MAHLDSRFSVAILVCLVATLSYLAARLGGALILSPQTGWPLWPGCALLVSVLLLVPRRIWSILIAAAFAAFVVYDLQTGLAIGSIAWLILADTVEVLIAALCVSYSFDGGPRLNGVKALAKYSLFAVILAPVAGAFIGAIALGGDYWTSWRISFFSEALAFLTLTPAVLSWVSEARAWSRKSRAEYFEAIVLVTALVVFGYITFVASGKSAPPALLYSVVPFLLWSGLRFGSMGASTSVIVIVFLSIWGAVHGRGPFTQSGPLSDVLSLQLFLFFAATPFMVLAALVEEHKQAEQALRESDKRFRLVADTAPVLIWMSGTDKLCTYFNKPWLDYTGRPIDSELGNGWAEGVHGEDLQRCLDTYTHAFDRRESFGMEYRLRRHDGEYRWVLDSGVPRFHQNGSFAGYIGSCFDVTDRRLAERDLAVANERLRLAMQSGKSVGWEWDIKSGRDSWFGDLRTMFGIPSDTYVGQVEEFRRRVHPEDRGLVWKAANDAMQSHKPYAAEFRVLWPDGTVRWVAATGKFHYAEDGEAERMLGMAVDITERKSAEEALSSVSRKLIQAQEQERTRIARELHDDTNQRLAMVAIGLERLKIDLPNSTVHVLGLVDKLRREISEISTDIQALSHELHSPRLEYLGIVAAMRGFCKEFGEQQKVEIDFRSHDLISPVPPDVSLCLFRVLQEGLHNSAKHSGARHFQVQLWEAAGEIHFTVSDSGNGFDLEAAMKSRGLGLTSMQERLQGVKGKFSIDSQPRRGTTIHARVPITPASDSVRAAG